MNKINLDSLNREELARFIVANRDTPEGIEARRIYISSPSKKSRKLSNQVLSTSIDRVGSVDERKLKNLQTFFPVT